MAQKSILLSNLPLTTTASSSEAEAIHHLFTSHFELCAQEADVQAVLSKSCGEVKTLAMCKSLRS